MEGFKLDGIYSYSLPFKKPLQIGGNTLSTRDGLIIRVIRGDGTAGYGEAAPLAGYSYETLSQAKDQLEQISNLLPNQLYPSVAFALETALFPLGTVFKSRARQGETPGAHRDFCLVNALLIPRPGGIDEQVRELVEEGFRVIKVKVGRGSVDSDIQLVNRVLNALPEGICLRLDANRNWRTQQALRFGRGLNPAIAGSIEYIEEPVKDISGIPVFYKETGLGVALDESLHGLTPAPEALPEGVKALVLKPSMIGATGNTLSWMRLAQNMGLSVVISSCFEVGPGFAALLELAVSQAGEKTASGLDTLKYLERTLFMEPVEIKRGRISGEILSGFMEKSIEQLYDFGKLKKLDTGISEADHAR